MKKLIAALVAGILATSVAMANGAGDAGKAGGAAAKWPTRAVQLHAASRAGGVTDIYTRNVANYLQTATGGNFAVVNYGTDAVAYQTVLGSRPDGTSLLFQHSTLLCRYVTGQIDYNPLEKFRIVGEVADMGGQAIIVHPDAPYNTWNEFIEYCRKNPGKVNVGIATNGSTHFIFGEVQRHYGIQFNLVECYAESDKLTNVAGGNIDMANCTFGNAKEYEKAGRLKILGIIGSGKPEPAYPEWEPIKDVIWISHMYVFAPKTMDDATAHAINEALKGLPTDATYTAACKSIGGVAEWYDLETCQKDLEKELEKLKAIGTSLGINHIK